MLPVRVKATPTGSEVSVELNGKEYLLRGVRSCNIQLHVDAHPSCQIDLAPQALDLTRIEGELYCFIGSNRLRLVDESKFDVIHRSTGINDSTAFMPPETPDIREALVVAAAALKWGHEEMKGRPPQHWLDALAKVNLALAATPAKMDEVPYLGPDSELGDGR